MRIVLLVVSALLSSTAQPDDEHCAVATDRGCVGPICDLHSRAVEDRNQALILERSLKEENYNRGLKVLERDAASKGRGPSDFDMVVVSAERAARAYELKVKYENEKTEAANKNSCD